MSDLANLALNAVVFFAGVGAHAIWLRFRAWLKARHDR